MVNNGALVCLHLGANFLNFNNIIMWKEFMDGYEVSDTGEVRNSVTKKKIQAYTSRGYLRLRIRHKGFCSLIHRLVLSTFKPIPHADRYVVNHIDGNPFNNRIENLHWCSQKENIKHSKSVTKNGAVISKKKILDLYSKNKDVSLEEFIDLMIENCK